MSILQFPAVVEPHFTRSPHKVKIANAFYCLGSLPFLEALEVKVQWDRDNMYTLGRRVGLSFQKIQCTAEPPLCCPGNADA